MKWKLTGLIVLAGLVFIWLVKTPILAACFSHTLDIPISMRTVTIWPSETVIHKLKVKNPHGFQKSVALMAEETHVTYQWSQLFKPVRAFDEITFDGVEIDVTCLDSGCSQNNWQALGAKLAKKHHTSRPVVIHKLVLTNVTINIQGLKGQNSPQTRHVDRIELHEINSEHGFPTKEAIAQVFQEAGLQQYIQGVLSVPINIVPTLFKAF